MSDANLIRRRRPQSERCVDLSPLAPVLERWLGELTDRLTDSLMEDIPEYGTFAWEETHRQAAVQLRHVYAELSGSEGPEGTEGPEAYGRLRAEQGIALETVLRVYRVAWTELWEGLVNASRLDGPSDEWLLGASASFLWMADRFAERMLLAYRRRSHELLLTNAATRGAMLEGLFTGFVNGDEDLWRAAGVLDLPYEGLFVVVAAETAAPGVQALPEVSNFLSALGLHSVWRLGPELEVGVVSIRKPELRAALLQRLKRYPAVRIGVSPVFDDLARTPKALHMARLVLGTIPPGTAGIKEFDQSELASLVAGAPDTAIEIRDAAFGQLLALPEADITQLLETLRGWFDSGGDVPAAAKALYVHPNTVRYRLRKLQTVTGRSLDDPRNISLLQAALLTDSLIPRK